MKRVLLGAVAVLALSNPARANGTLMSIEPFQSQHTWQVNWDSLNRRASAVAAQWQCGIPTGSPKRICDRIFMINPGVKVLLRNYGNGSMYCFFVRGLSTIDCYHNDGQKMVWSTSHSPPIAQGVPPAVSQSSSFSVPLTSDGAGEYMSVKLGSTYYDMLVDTGATSGQIPEETANALIAAGEATEVQGGYTTFGNGATQAERRVSVYSVQVGDHRIYNVTFGVGPSFIFGLTPLSRFGKFTLDAQNGLLLFN